MEKKDNKKQFEIDNFYYNIQHKRHLPFPYMFLTKEVIAYTILVFVYIFIYEARIGIVTLAIILAGYVYLHQNVFNDRIKDKENIWVVVKIKNFLKIGEDDNV